MLKQPLKVGNQSPDFKLESSDGQSYSLSDFKGQWLVLYFYPRDNTPGCTIEAKDFTALVSKFKKENVVVVGVSRDSCASHQKFIDKQNLKLFLLSDSDHKVQEAFGVWGKKKFMGRESMGTIRSTFLIDPQGIIRQIWDNVKVKGHAEAVLAEKMAIRLE